MVQRQDARKGGHSSAKKGFGKKTGKSVALKFMAKADPSSAKEQVVTEIESLKQTRHHNVMKLPYQGQNRHGPSGARVHRFERAVDFADTI